MKLFLIFLSHMCVMDTEAQFKHHQTALSACSDADQEYMRGLDEDEVFYSDFTNKKGVLMLPPFSGSTEFPGLYEFSESEMISCKQTLQLWKEEFKDTPVSEDAPRNTIYPRDDIQLGSENTLVCHSTRFFPPPIGVRWTKNNVDVTNTSTISRYYPNRDGTYNQFSHLPFTPQEGDVYTCTVQHKTLETPDTKTMEVDVELPSVGPAVFCGVGLAVGLLGVATGTFFLVKGNQCN